MTWLSYNTRLEKVGTGATHWLWDVVIPTWVKCPPSGCTSQPRRPSKPTWWMVSYQGQDGGCVPVLTTSSTDRLSVPLRLEASQWPWCKQLPKQSVWGNTGQDWGPGHRSHRQNIKSESAARGLKKTTFFLFSFRTYPVVSVPHNASRCAPLKQEMSDSSQDPTDVGDGISFLHWLIKGSSDERSTGFDFKDLSHWLWDLFYKAQGEYLTLP